ncbi:MAG: hypothetical protein IPJ77_09585 [Planctomycetes bacterium]|nr:hypothetical protein [Planctomycetota bacterium]
MRLDHPIFHRPHEVQLDLDEFTPPAAYRDADGTRPAGKLPCWRVFDQRLSVENLLEVGSVCFETDFEDSPDAEWISGGVSSKPRTAMALGRQGNFFQWGFAGDPAQMTPSARLVFVNAICFMKDFDGHFPLVQGSGLTRECVDGWLEIAQSTWEKEGEERAIHALAKGFGWHLLELAGAADGPIERRIETLRAWLREHAGFLHPDKFPGEYVHLLPDADLVALGAPNREHAFFARLFERWRVDPTDALAWRLLKRYVSSETYAPFSSAAEFSTWYATNRVYLFFSDSGGFQWQVDLHARARDQRRAAERAKDEPKPR